MAIGPQIAVNPTPQGANRNAQLSRRVRDIAIVGIESVEDVGFEDGLEGHNFLSIIASITLRAFSGLSTASA